MQSNGITKGEKMPQASLILGILALIFTFIPGHFGVLGVLCAVAGIITGVLGRKNNPEYYNTATAGLIISIIAIVLRLIVVIACAACVIGILSLI